MLQIGTDSAGRALGLHSRLSGLRSIFNDGRLAIIQRTGYTNSSRSHFLGTDIWSTADPASPQGAGWLGRYLDTLPAPVDALTAWSTARETPRTLMARTVGVPSIPDPQQYAFASPNGGADAVFARQSARDHRVARPRRPAASGLRQRHSAGGVRHARSRVTGGRRTGPPSRIRATGLGQALRTVAGAMAFGIGTRVFWVQTGGFDTHALQRPNLANGAYAGLMSTLDGALAAFYTDLRGQGLFGDTLVVHVLGVRPADQRERQRGHRPWGRGTDVRDGWRRARRAVRHGGHTCRRHPTTPRSRTAGNDVRHETDFRAVYATVIDRWLGGDSVAVLGGNYRGGPAFL